MSIVSIAERMVIRTIYCIDTVQTFLTLLHSERPKLYSILAFLSAIGLSKHVRDERNLFAKPFLDQIPILRYSRLSLSRSRRDPLKHFEISVLRHIRCAELRKTPNEQPNFTNEHVI